MAYATIADVEAILPEDETIPVDAEDRLQVALEEATDLVIGFLYGVYTGADDNLDGVPDDVPDAVRRVVARVTLRAFLDDAANPGAESEVNLMGPFSHTINWSKEAQARDFYLTDSDKLRLERYVAVQYSGAAYAPMAGACGDWSTNSYRYRSY